MKLFNTLTKEIEEFSPSDHEVTMYTCGPTVYLDPQIGNWRTFILYDLLSRTLTLAGYIVNHTLNITDVGHLVSDGDEGEDKLAKTAQAQRKTAWEIADHYTDIFLDGLSELNIKNPTHLPRATELIQEQIDMVQTLEEKGYTYKTDDGIYFDTSKFENYGKMARLDLDGQEAGARVEVNEQKKQQQDFALWKLSPKDQNRDMEWDSPWGVGFPGWHLECSVMALKYLGKTIDIHAGGIDHIPVHHTNEIAQSEVANDAQFSRFWIHGEFMTVDGTKMSKSLGNSYSLEDLKQKGYEPLAFRLFVLQAHYQSESNFTWDALDAASHRLNHLRQMADLRFQTVDSGENKDRKEIYEGIRDSLLNNLNTPKVLEFIGELQNDLDQRLPSDEELEQLTEILNLIDDTLGLDLMSSNDITDDQKKIISEREEARDSNDFENADKLRDKLLSQGIEIKDLADKSVWQRI